jgi:hypothetical protein
LWLVTEQSDTADNLLLGLRPAIPVRVRVQDFDVSKALVDPITNQHKEE